MTMPSREEKSRIDAQWEVLQPGWGRKEHDGERKMLYKVLADGETIERLAGGGWKVRQRGEVMESHDRGIVVATSDRVFLLNKGRLSKNVVELAFWEISAVTEREPGELRINGPGGNFTMELQDGAAASLAGFVRSRLLTDESVQRMFSHVLESGETVKFWAHCSAGLEIVSKYRSGRSDHTPDYDHTDSLALPAVALATDRRIFVTHLEDKEGWAHGTILAVEYWGGRKVRLVDFDGEIHILQFGNDSAAEPFVALMREHMAATGQRVSKERRTSGQWKLQHPLWSDRGNHRGEREKLGEILQDGEQIEAMVWGGYESEREAEYSHTGIIAATGRRVLFVSGGWLDQNVAELPYQDISGISGGRLHLKIDAAPGHIGYVVRDMDDMSAHDSREKGQGAEFVRRLRLLVDEAPSKPSAGSP